jgi:hydrogenase/urease accessory protein HupE
MRKILSALFLIAVFAIHSPVVFAQDKDVTSTIEKSANKAADKAGDAAKDVAKDVQDEVDTAKEKITDNSDKNSSNDALMNDIHKARDIIMNGTGGNIFARGMLIALLQPIFIAAMFCLGLWAGEMSEKLKHIWALPVIVYAATMIGAFITTYHAEWKPDETHYKFLSHLQSTDTVAIIIGVVIGVAVALQFTLPSFFAMFGVAAIGLILGFSQTSQPNAQHSIINFWAGFGLTGLLVNIFGIGFETFFQSINLKLVTRLVGAATTVLSIYFGAKLL